jgi:hypothetical protein
MVLPLVAIELLNRGNPQPQPIGAVVMVMVMVMLMVVGMVRQW